MTDGSPVVGEFRLAKESVTLQRSESEVEEWDFSIFGQNRIRLFRELDEDSVDRQSLVCFIR